MPPANVVQAAVHSGVLFADGDPVDFADFNSAQTLAAMEVLDRTAHLLNQIGGEDPEAELVGMGGLPGRRCYVPRVAGAMPYNNGLLRVSTTRGMIYAKNPDGASTPDGADPVILSYLVPAVTSLFTLDAADGSNPRIDLVQVKLELIEDTPSVKDFEDAVTRTLSDSASTNRRTRVQATWAVKQGTPAATPVRPTADTGYVEWAAIRVNAAATTYGLEDLWDLRVPMRLEVQRVPPMAMQGGDTWSRAADDDFPAGYIKTANDTKALWAFPHAGLIGGRIVGVGLAALFANGAGGNEAASLMRLVGDNPAAAVATEVADVFSSAGFVAGSRQRSQMETEFATTTGGGMGSRPIWTNFHGPQELWGAGGLPSDAADWNRIGLRLRGDALSEVHEVWFYVAVDL